MDGKVMFCGSDVAKALGYSRPNDAISAHCRATVKHSIPISGKMQRINFIPEGDIYRLIVRSKLPSAEKFESWVFDEVLPTIHKTGGYVANENMFVNTYLPFADDNVKNLFRLQLRTITQLNNKIEADKPLVDFATTVSDASNLIDMAQMAKLLHDEKINIGRNKLFKWLQNNKYLRSNNEPYQQYINNGYFKVKEYTYNTPYGTKVGTKTYITGKGQIYITEKLRKLYA